MKKIFSPKKYAVMNGNPIIFKKFVRSDHHKRIIGELTLSEDYQSRIIFPQNDFKFFKILIIFFLS